MKELRLETVGQNLEVKLIGVARGQEHDEWDCTIFELLDLAKIRGGVFSVSKHVMTVGELLDIHSEWEWSLDP